mmetsp:Transcript_51420/g.166749  ORF Transcript_51420/g.166749 Transcript_51420/m.166749 type:complete len:256 (-) Transcript_51420:68-835(-)
MTPSASQWCIRSLTPGLRWSTIRRLAALGYMAASRSLPSRAGCRRSPHPRTCGSSTTSSCQSRRPDPRARGETCLCTSCGCLWLWASRWTCTLSLGLGVPRWSCSRGYRACTRSKWPRRGTSGPSRASRCLVRGCGEDFCPVARCGATRARGMVGWRDWWRASPRPTASAWRPSVGARRPWPATKPMAAATATGTMGRAWPAMAQNSTTRQVFGMLCRSSTSARSTSDWFHLTWSALRPLSELCAPLPMACLRTG